MYIYFRKLFPLLTLLAVLGCGKSSGNRHDIWGTVQWRGKPIPAGILFISPNVKKGNSGVQGFAKIKDGKFDTRNDNGKGGPTGAVQITVDGVDGKAMPNAPIGRTLFGADKPVIEAEIKPGGMELNLTVPDNATPATPGNAEPLN